MKTAHSCLARVGYRHKNHSICEVPSQLKWICLQAYCTKEFGQTRAAGVRIIWLLSKDYFVLTLRIYHMFKTA